MNRFRDVLAGYAAELRATQEAHPEGPMLTPERREALFARLQAADVHIDRRTYDQADAFIADQLGNELTRAFFGSDSLLRRKARTDRQLQAAVQMIRGAHTQDDALTAAMKIQLSGQIR
jgi:hypothetical protein